MSSRRLIKHLSRALTLPSLSRHHHLTLVATTTTTTLLSRTHASTLSPQCGCFSSLSSSSSSTSVDDYSPQQHFAAEDVEEEFPDSVTTELYASYASARIRCPRHVADVLSEALLSFGASSTSVDEDEGNKNNDEVCISSIFIDCQEVDVNISRAANSIGLKEIPEYEIDMGEQFDWTKKIQESFYPVKITEGLWIVPEWRTCPDMGATNIILNPGLAFGTGEHPTTKLCLLLLLGLIKGGEVVLDYGTGSGVLAIAALKFGAALSVGVDVDPQAVTAGRQNASLNSLGPDKIQFHLVPDKAFPLPVDDGSNGGQNTVGDIYGTEKFDVVIANILLNPLLDLADNIVSYAKPGSFVGISGILSEQVSHVMDRYSQYLDGIIVQEMDGWACVRGRRRINLTKS